MINGHRVVDLHCDLFEFSRRYRRDPRKIHRRVPWFSTELHSDLPRHRAAGTDVIVAGIYAPFRRGESAWRSAQRTLDFMDRIGPHAGPEVVRSLEGAHLLGGRPERVAEARRRGVVSIGLAHLGPNDCVTGRGLTGLGREVLAACRESGVLVDLAHTPDRPFWQVLEADAGPVFASHSGARSVHAHHRLLADDQIAAIGARGGVVGVIFAPWYLTGRPWAGLDAVIDHAVAVAEAGGDGCIAFGSDWDGAVTMPHGLEDPSGLPALAARLAARGLGPLIKGFLGANADRFLNPSVN